MTHAIIAGMTLGLSITLPFGPVSLVCVQRSVADGVRPGLVTGMGAASAHGIFATAALLGQEVVSSELVRWAGPVRWLSAALLLCLGIRTLVRRSRPTGQAGRASLPVAYGSGLALALTNPMTVLPYLALASGAVAGNGTAALFSPWSVPGIVAGAITCYAALCFASTAFRPGMLRGVLPPLNLVAGVILVAFGVRVALG